MRDYRNFELYPGRGFLPEQDPLQKLPAAFDPWEEVASQLPKLLVTTKARQVIEAMKLPDFKTLKPGAEIERAHMLISFIGHAYVWSEVAPPKHIPQSVAVPWYWLSHQLDRPPSLSYASYALHNWRRIIPSDPIEAGNIALLQNFLAGADEEWFVIIHVDIEAKAAPALLTLFETQDAISAGDSQTLSTCLATIAVTCERLYASLSRMYEKCDPYMYYNRVRPYIHGWEGNPAIPNGLVYEGVAEYQGKPQAFRGETGAQSSLIPSLDAVLGTAHVKGPLSGHLMAMRAYMPRPHRQFIESLEQGPNLREFVVAHHGQTPGLRDNYNAAVQWVEKFREKHLEFAINYIDKQQQTTPGNPTKVGTGATPYVEYLRRHKEHTAKHLI